MCIAKHVAAENGVADDRATGDEHRQLSNHGKWGHGPEGHRQWVLSTMASPTILVADDGIANNGDVDNGCHG